MCRASARCARRCGALHERIAVPVMNASTAAMTPNRRGRLQIVEIRVDAAPTRCRRPKWTVRSSVHEPTAPARRRGPNGDHASHTVTVTPVSVTTESEALAQLAEKGRAGHHMAGPARVQPATGGDDPALHHAARPVRGQGPVAGDSLDRRRRDGPRIPPDAPYSACREVAERRRSRGAVLAWRRASRHDVDDRSAAPRRSCGRRDPAADVVTPR